MINKYHWVTIELFTELTGTNVEKVKANIKAKGSLHKFTARLTPRSKIMVNYKGWLQSLTTDLQADEDLVIAA